VTRFQSICSVNNPLHNAWHEPFFNCLKPPWNAKIYDTIWFQVYHLAATQLQHFNLVHWLFLLATKNVLYKLLNKSFITILYFRRFFGLSCLNYTVLSSTMTNPPLPQLQRERERERGRRSLYSALQSCAEFQHPWGWKQMKDKNRDITEGWKNGEINGFCTMAMHLVTLPSQCSSF